MTKAKLDLQKQLQQTSSDLTTQPLFNDSLVLFLEPIDQVNAQPSEEKNKLNKPLLQKFTLLLIIHMENHHHRKNAAKI